jgi:hypothetical protein
MKCTNTDQSAAAFGGGEDPDEDLPLVSDLGRIAGGWI